eukprot:NODE_41_length_29768_cov_0.533924.p9 type:complete len:296 gc:universal NODE_41_length_29768_cov_0.533924:22861-21974(-)
MIHVVLFGQLISILLTFCSTSSQFLSQYKLPTFQLVATYFGLCCYLIYYRSIPQDFRYVLIAFLDVMANYCLIKAYQYTDLLSISLLNRLSIPIVMALSKYFLNAKYKSKNYLGMLVCVSGSMMIVYIDYNKNNGKASWIGDILCVVGASLYAMANVLQEYLIKNSPIEDYLTGIGGYGFVFSLILLAFEYKELSYFRMESNATMHFGMCISVFVISMFLLYSLVPRLIVKSSATMFNLSILTSDFYNLLAGVYIFGLKLTAIYGVAFAVIIVGLAIFHSGEKKRNDMGEEVVVI